MIPPFINKSLLPHKSGVYQFKDKTGQVIYVGKAMDLYHRVASYFAGVHDAKTNALVEKIASIETIIVESELEALILEANLIKKYLPQFNVRLTDDKDYLYIGITKEDLPARLAGGPAGRQAFPKIITCRKHELKGMKKFFGPFPSSRTVRDTLKLLRRVFPWCSNPPKKASFLDNGVTLETTISRGSAVIAKTRTGACFYYHLGLCPGACVGLISKEDYNKILRRFSKFLEGKKDELIEELMNEMNKLAKEQRYEEAAKLKKMISGISYLTQQNRASLYLENPNFLEDENKLAVEQLQKDLNLEKLPERIEAYDISNIQGKESVGSMVVLINGEIDKSQYRKFKIHMTGRPNDVGMHKEMMRRRLKHPEWKFPDLIIVDGGRGQAKAVKFQISSSHLADEIPVFGLAKKEEWLYPPEGEIVKLSRKSLSLKLLQKVRDEAHRFAISYHRKLHTRVIFNN